MGMGAERREVNAGLNVQGMIAWWEERENKFKTSVSQSAIFIHEYSQKPRRLKIAFL